MSNQEFIAKKNAHAAWCATEAVRLRKRYRIFGCVQFGIALFMAFAGWKTGFALFYMVAAGCSFIAVQCVKMGQNSWDNLMSARSETFAARDRISKLCDDAGDCAL